MHYVNLYTITFVAVIETQKVRQYISWKIHTVTFGHVVVINDKDLVLSR